MAMRRTLTAFLLIGHLVALLSACADGSGNSTSASNPTSGSNPLATAPRLGKGSVVVRIVDTTGSPVPDAWASVTDRTGNVRAEPVGADGYATFGGILEGPAELNASAWGYYDAGIRTPVTADRSTREQVTLERRNASTAAVLGTRAVSKSADGRTLVLETDIAVLDESGQPLLGLTDALFELPAIDCGWGLCINGPDGQEIAGWVPVTGAPEAFGLVTAAPRRPFAAGLLVDQGSIVQDQQSDPFRVNAIVEFLERFTGTDSVALAEFSKWSGAPALQQSGDFVSDGRLLLDSARSLDQRVGGSSPVVPAVQEMLGIITRQPPVLPPTLVLISNTWLEASDRLVLAAASRAASTPIVTISNHEAAADLAARTGGVFVKIEFPATYRTALRSLDSLLSGELPFYRMRFSVTSNYAAAFTPGNTLFTYVRIRLNERDHVFVPVVLPFPVVLPN
jgi:hypothetical protein